MQTPSEFHASASHMRLQMGAPLQRRAERAVGVLAGAICIGALYGGVRLLLDAEALGAKQSWLDGSLFPDYRIPGAVLTVVVGGGMLLTALAALRHSPSTGPAAFAMGATLLAWGAVETLTIGYQGPAQLVLLVLFVVGPAVPLLMIGWHAMSGANSHRSRCPVVAPDRQVSPDRARGRL